MESDSCQPQITGPALQVAEFSASVLRATLEDALERFVEGTETCPPQSKVLIESLFDNDDESWTVFADGTLAYVEEGGNPGGHLSVVDQGAGAYWYFQAPDTFHGDYSAAYGGLLSFDLKQSSLNNQADQPDIILGGGSIVLTFDTSSNPGLDWTDYAVRLHENAGWLKDDNTPAAKDDIITVLSSIDDLRIRGEFISGGDIGQLDNVAISTP